jgi:hypothetical protein
MADGKERKVVYRDYDSGEIRVIRGKVYAKDGIITVERRDGVKRLSISIVLEIKDIDEDDADVRRH